PKGLERLDQTFLTYLEEGNGGLALRLQKARQIIPSSLEESTLLLDLSPYLEDFLGTLFRIEKEVTALQSQAHTLAPLYRCKRLFVQRQAAKAFSQDHAKTFKGPELKDQLTEFLGEPYSDLAFARHVLKALENVPEQKMLLALA